MSSIRWTAVGALIALSGVGSAQVQWEQISVSTTGTHVYGSAASLDDAGNRVVFWSSAPNLVPVDTNNTWDIFVRDRTSATTTLASVSSTGVQTNASSWNPSISGDGELVAFTTTASTLIPALANGSSQLYVHEVDTGVTEMVSLTPGGTAGNGFSSISSFSYDGRFVAFTSSSTDLVAANVGTGSHVYVRDRLLGTTQWVSQPPSGTPSGFGSSGGKISRDGRYVTFQSWDDGLVTNDNNGLPDAFRADLLLGTIELVSVHPNGFSANGGAGLSSLSGDGRFVSFQSKNDWLAPNQVGSGENVYLRDLDKQLTRLVAATGYGAVGTTDVSDDGRIVTWPLITSIVPAPGAVPLDNVFYRDMWQGGAPVNLTKNANDVCVGGPISADGRIIVMDTWSTNLGTPNVGVGVITATLPCRSAVSYCPQDLTSGGCAPAVSGIGTPSVSMGSFDVQASAMPGKVNGLFFWSTVSDIPPFWGVQTKARCVLSPAVRTGIQSTGGTKGVCDGALTLDWFDWASSHPAKAPTVGTTVYVQGWFRDTGAASNTAFTPALAFSICP
jgi:hypothetical protein